MYEAKWNKEWPEEEGFYWAYGNFDDRWAIGGPKMPEKYLLQVYVYRFKDHMCYRATTKTIYKKDFKNILWTKMIAPENPE